MLLSSVLKAHVYHLQKQGVQWHSPDLGCCEILQLIIFRFGVQAKADAGPRSSRSPLTLLRRGAANPELLQPLHLVLWIVAYFLDLSRVDYESESVDCDWGLGNVGCYNELLTIKHLNSYLTLEGTENKYSRWIDDVIWQVFSSTSQI